MNLIKILNNALNASMHVNNALMKVNIRAHSAMRTIIFIHN